MSQSGWRLRKYASRTDGSPLAANLVARSSAMTFFFQFLYIQQHINMLVESGLDAASVLDKIKRAYQVNS